MFFIVVANSNIDNQDLGSLLPNGSSSGFLSNAVPPPRRFSFTRNFTINPDWTDVCFPEDANVSVILVGVAESCDL